MWRLSDGSSLPFIPPLLCLHAPRRHIHITPVHRYTSVSLQPVLVFTRHQYTQWTFLSVSHTRMHYNTARWQYQHNIIKHRRYGRPCLNCAQSSSQFAPIPCTVHSFTVDAKPLKRWMRIAFPPPPFCARSGSHTLAGANTKIILFSFLTPCDSCQNDWNESPVSSLCITIWVCVFVAVGFWLQHTQLHPNLHRMACMRTKFVQSLNNYGKVSFNKPVTY